MQLKIGCLLRVLGVYPGYHRVELKKVMRVSVYLLSRKMEQMVLYGAAATVP